ncbi:MAG: cell division protein SepF [Armatimonadota bacterium]
MNNGDPSVDEFGHKSIFRRVKDTIFPTDDLEEEYEEETHAALPKRSSVPARTSTGRVNHVSVRQPLSFDDARLAADGLKDGRQQIVNLERTNHELAERIIDFLNGVTYALNGFVEKISDRVYLFAPNNVVIEVSEDARNRSTPGLFDHTF